MSAPSPNPHRPPLQIADSFGFDAQERDVKLGGDIALGFFLVGAPVVLATGYLADVYNRTLLFGAITVFASTACAMSYFAQTYTQFFVARILTGVGVGGAPAVVFSTLADFYRYAVQMSRHCPYRHAPPPSSPHPLSPAHPRLPSDRPPPTIPY